MQEISRIYDTIRKAKFSKYPFRHFYTDNFFDSIHLDFIKEELNQLEKSFPDKIFSSPYGQKREYKNFPITYPVLNNLMKFLQSEDFINELKTKFQIDPKIKIYGDNSFDGGGYVISPPNSFLGYHADFNFSSNMGKYRVLNLLIYMNSGYEPEHGGHLHALDPISKTVEASFLPNINSAFAFFTDDKSFHGVSKNGKDFYRRSFNLYYYADVPISEDQTVNPHKTIWLDIDTEKHEE